MLEEVDAEEVAVEKHVLHHRAHVHVYVAYVAVGPYAVGQKAASGRARQPYVVQRVEPRAGLVEVRHHDDGRGEHVVERVLEEMSVENTVGGAHVFGHHGGHDAASHFADEIGVAVDALLAQLVAGHIDDFGERMHGTGAGEIGHGVHLLGVVRGHVVAEGYGLVKVFGLGVETVGGEQRGNVAAHGLDAVAKAEFLNLRALRFGCRGRNLLSFHIVVRNALFHSLVGFLEQALHQCAAVAVAGLRFGVERLQDERMGRGKHGRGFGSRG